MKVIFNVVGSSVCFNAFKEAMVTVKAGDYYNTPAGFKTLPRDRDGDKEDFYCGITGEVDHPVKFRRCGYTIRDNAVVYIGSAGNMSWVRLISPDTVEVGYWGARHGNNLRRLLDDDQYDRLVDMTPVAYETQEPGWRWDETLDEHPEDPRHRSHWPDEAA